MILLSWEVMKRGKGIIWVTLAVLGTDFAFITKEGIRIRIGSINLIVRMANP